MPVTKSERTAYHRDDVGQNARSIIEAFRLEAERLTARAQIEASAAIEKEAKYHTGRFTASVWSQAQIDVKHLLRDDDLVDFLSVRSEQINSLITNLAQDVHNRIERETLGAIFEGRSNADIAKSISGIEDIGRRRATLIARDQASKLNGSMNELRQRQAGVTFYKWKTILDGRERPTHNANNGRVFSWDRPSRVTGHPGRDINCRCRALAVITDDPVEVENEAAPAVTEGGLDDNAALFERVASTPAQNVFSWAPDALSARQAELTSVQELVAAYRTSNAFAEADAERLAEIIYGGVPDDATLMGLYGSKLGAMVVRRRTLLLNAVTERLDLVSRLLAQAAASQNLKP